MNTYYARKPSNTRSRYSQSGVPGMPFCCVCCVCRRVCSRTAWDGARWLCALVRCRQKRHHEELQKSGCQRSATGKANDAPFTAKPNAGSQETIEVKCLNRRVGRIRALQKLFSLKKLKKKVFSMIQIYSNNKTNEIDHLECWQRLHLPSCLSGNWSVTNVFLTFASSQ